MSSSKKSYSSILKSSSLIGGSEALTFLIGMITTKAVAVFLGPLGVGLSGTYGSILTLATRLSDFGISSSGVREIAAAIGSRDDAIVGRSVCTLRRICWLTGLLGSGAVALFARPISQATFGSTEYAWAIMLLAWTILMRNIQNGQMVYIQGSRRIGDLARLKIIGEIGGATIGVGFYAWLRLDGIVPAMISLAAFNLAASWWFARKAPPPRVVMTWKESLIQSKGFVLFGAAFMYVGVLAAAGPYLTRLMLNRELSMDAVGIFQSAFRMSVFFVNFVLGAMGTDFYPRLAMESSDHSKMCRSVNEQTEIGLLIAIPGLIAMLAFAPWVIRIFYTSAFLESAKLLNWFVLGCLLRVITAPMGFILPAKGLGRWFSASHTFYNVLNLFLIFILIKQYNVLGVAIAYFVSSLAHGLLIYGFARYLIGFSWTATTRKLLIFLLPLAGGQFMAAMLLPELQTAAIGILTTAGASFFCFYELGARVGEDHKIFRMIRKVPFLGPKMLNLIFR